MAYINGKEILFSAQVVKGGGGSCLTGEGSPTPQTGGGIGSLYMDTLTGELYKCTAENGGTYTWGVVATGVGGSSTVHVGSDTPPDGATIWIDPNGEPTSTEEWEFAMDDGSKVTKTVVVTESEA